MHISERVNLKKYFILSAPLLALTYFLAKNPAEFKVMGTVFLAACLNQFLLVKGVLKMTNSAVGKEPTDKLGLMSLFAGKAIVLIVALTFGVQIMGKRIIIPVLIYVLQIAVLTFSMKKTEAEQGTN